MAKLFSFVLMCLLVPVLCSADTLVTWASDGVVRLSHYANQQNTGFVPPPGTSYELTMSFDPSTMTPTVLGVPGSNCFTVGVAGQISFGGGASYGLSGSGFTHARLPGLTCSPASVDTQFLLGLSAIPDENPWPALRQGSFMEIFYTDALVRDSFPAVPTGSGLFQIREQSGSFLVTGNLNFRAVPEQPTPVPEPGTMALVGLGLAAALRRARAARRV